jgi:hypothetical protein
MSLGYESAPVSSFQRGNARRGGEQGSKGIRRLAAAESTSPGTGPTAVPRPWFRGMVRVEECPAMSCPISFRIAGDRVR